MTELRALGGYSAAKPVAPVVPPHTETKSAKTTAKAPEPSQSNRGPAVKVTLSAEATKALEASRAAEAAKAATAAKVTAATVKVLEKHETASTAKVAAAPVAKAPEKPAAPVTAEHR